MYVTELLNEVCFSDVKKELLLSNMNLQKVLPQLETYFESLKTLELSTELEKNKIQVSREYFDTSYFVTSEQKDVVTELTTFVPAELILSSEIAKEDLVDLEKPLIASAILILLTFNGTCFSEEERQSEIERLKTHMEELNES